MDAYCDHVTCDMPQVRKCTRQLRYRVPTIFSGVAVLCMRCVCMCAGSGNEWMVRCSVCPCDKDTGNVVTRGMVALSEATEHTFVESAAGSTAKQVEVG